MVTPAEKWYGVRPDLSKVKVFGSVPYLHKPKELQAWVDSISRTASVV
jgi:hypothetical protein